MILFKLLIHIYIIIFNFICIKKMKNEINGIKFLAQKKLLIFGSKGVGKSDLALSLCEDAIEKEKKLDKCK